MIKKCNGCPGRALKEVDGSGLAYAIIETIKIFNSNLILNKKQYVNSKRNHNRSAKQNRTH